MPLSLRLAASLSASEATRSVSRRRRLRVLLDARDGVGVEDVAVAAGEAHAMDEVLRGVAGCGLREPDAGVDA
jgi:hypothetical protein